MGEALDVKELAREFNVSVRTIQKDLNQRLIYWDIRKNKDGRYVLFNKPDFLKDLNIIDFFTRDLICSIITELDTHFSQSAKKFFNSQSNSPALLTNFSSEPLKGKIKTLILLYQAIQFRQSLVFTYINLKKEQKNYFVNPYKLALLDGYWYLLGFCKTDNKIKSFYIKNISHLQVSPETFEPDKKLLVQVEENLKQLKSAWLKPEMKTAKLKIKRDAYRYLCRSKPSNLHFVEKKLHYCLAEIRYFQETEVLMFVKKWLPDIIVLKPPELNEQLKEILKEYLKFLK
jgi:predicted DNA-binding transcriptional regulator YafY